jgi:hypothetical protein
MYHLAHSWSVMCALSLCIPMILVGPALPQNLQGDENLPVLYGARLDGSHLLIDVVSFGCTDASYFSVHLDPTSANTYRLSVVPEKQDRCRVSAHIITVVLNIPTVSDLARARFLFMNRFATPVTLPRSEP